MSRPVLHGPVEVAGQVALSAHGLRAAGWPASSYCAPHPFAFGIAPDASPPVGRPLRYVARTTRLLARHAIVHLHFATSFVAERRRQPDVRLLRRVGREVLMTFHGSEVRRPAVERARNPHYVPFAGEDDATALTRLHRWAELLDGRCVVCDPGLVAHVADVFDRVDRVPLQLDTARYTPAFPQAGDGPPVVVHSPSEREGKGTRFVREAVAALRAGGVELEYVEVFGRPQAEALALYARADVVVDQLCVGSHGVFALEAMALGKPVVCHLVDDVVAALPADQPIVRATPETLAAVLGDLLADRGALGALGRRSRAYVEREHDTLVAGRRLAELYAGL